MPDEIPAPAAQTPVPPIPPGETPPPAPVQADPPAPPPATKIVVTGTKTERELDLERQLEANARLIRDRETVISEREAEIQRLREVPAPPRPPKQKRKPNWSDPVFGGGDE